jgi:predicted Zn-dependent peptidase
MAVQVTTLDNGLRVVTDRMDNVESAALGMWVGVGTRHEEEPINGVSHLLEHMAFKGTERRSAAQIASEIEAVGGHLNAYTSRETTAYYARVLMDDVPLATDILADILQHSTFDAEELERERTVILQEIGQAMDQPEDVVFDAFQEKAFPGQPMGRPVLGSPDVIREIHRDAVAGYMSDRYRTRRMVFSAAGRVEHDRIVDLVAAKFDRLRDGEMAAPEPSRYAGGESRDDNDLEQVHLVLGVEGVSYHDPDYHASQVLSTLYGGGMSSRLFQEVREKRGLVYSIYSFMSGVSDGGIFGVYAGTGEGQANEVLDIVCDEMRKVGEQVNADEVQRARAQLKASILMSRESTSARCEHAAQQMLMFGRPLTVAEIVAKIDAVDEAAVARVARRLGKTSVTVAATGPLGRMKDYSEIVARMQ